MHSVRPDFRRWSSAIRSSIRALHVLDSRAQSRRIGALSGGSLSSCRRYAGRIDFHPVFPGKPGYASRKIEGEDDIRDVIALLRLNYDRGVATHGLPQDAA